MVVAIAALYELVVKGPDLARPKRANPRLNLQSRHAIETDKYTTARHKGTESDGPDSLAVTSVKRIFAIPKWPCASGGAEPRRGRVIAR
jgi:hypothetical protein